MMKKITSLHLFWAVVTSSASFTLIYLLFKFGILNQTGVERENLFGFTLFAPLVILWGILSVGLFPSFMNPRWNPRKLWMGIIIALAAVGIGTVATSFNNIAYTTPTYPRPWLLLMVPLSIVITLVLHLYGRRRRIKNLDHLFQANAQILTTRYIIWLIAFWVQAVVTGIGITLLELMNIPVLHLLGEIPGFIFTLGGIIGVTSYLATIKWQPKWTPWNLIVRTLLWFVIVFSAIYLLTFPLGLSSAIYTVYSAAYSRIIMLMLLWIGLFLTLPAQQTKPSLQTWLGLVLGSIILLITIYGLYVRVSHYGLTLVRWFGIWGLVFSTILYVAIWWNMLRPQAQVWLKATILIILSMFTSLFFPWLHENRMVFHSFERQLQEKFTSLPQKQIQEFTTSYNYNFYLRNLDYFGVKGQSLAKELNKRYPIGENRSKGINDSPAALSQDFWENSFICGGTNTFLTEFRKDYEREFANSFNYHKRAVFWVHDLNQDGKDEVVEFYYSSRDPNNIASYLRVWHDGSIVGVKEIFNARLKYADIATCNFNLQEPNYHLPNIEINKNIVIDWYLLIPSMTPTD